MAVEILEPPHMQERIIHCLFGCLCQHGSPRFQASFGNERANDLQYFWVYARSVEVLGIKHVKAYRIVFGCFLKKVLTSSMLPRLPSSWDGENKARLRTRTHCLHDTVEKSVASTTCTSNPNLSCRTQSP
nr:hypothetical protein K4M19_00300 [Agrobacterium fabrum]